MKLILEKIECPNIIAIYSRKARCTLLWACNDNSLSGTYCHITCQIPFLPFCKPHTDYRIFFNFFPQKYVIFTLLA